MERNTRDASAFAFLEVEGDDFEAFGLGPTSVHAQKHSSPVTGFGAAGSGLDIEVGVVGVGGLVEEGDEFEGVECAIDGKGFSSGFLSGVEVVEFFGEFDGGGEVGEAGFDFEEGLDLACGCVFFGNHSLRGCLVIPEGGFGHPFFQFGQLVLQSGDVKDTS